MIRFVILATMRRGVLRFPEPLDEEGCQAALRQIELENAPRSVALSERVIWRYDSRRRKLKDSSLEGRARIDRMVELACKR